MPVYFAMPVDGAPVVKIGYSVAPRLRLPELYYVHRKPMAIVREVAGDFPTEAWYHAQFKHRRINGFGMPGREWFSFEPRMLTLDPPPDLRREGPPPSYRRMLLGVVCAARVAVGRSKARSLRTR